MLAVRKATDADFDRIMEIYGIARDYMVKTGNPKQWADGYPEEKLVREDIRTGICRVICEGERIHGVFALFEGEDPWYRVIEDGAWLNDAPYVAIHRIASDGETHGVFACAADYCKALCDNVRIDTHEDNRVMQHLILKNGFVRCGTVFVRGNSPRIAFQWTRK